MRVGVEEGKRVGERGRGKVEETKRKELGTLGREM